MAASRPEAGGLSNVVDEGRGQMFLSQPDGFTDVGIEALNAPRGGLQVREENLFARLDDIVAGIEPSYRPGHGWVIARTLAALSDSERDVSSSDDFPEVEVMKFVVDYKTGEQGFFVHQKGVFDGLQVSVSRDGQARIAGGYLDIERALDLIECLEQRSALRACRSQDPVF